MGFSTKLAFDLGSTFVLNWKHLCLGIPQLSKREPLAVIVKRLSLQTFKTNNLICKEILKMLRTDIIITLEAYFYDFFTYRLWTFTLENGIFVTEKLKERLNNCNEWTEFNSTDDTTHLLKGFANMKQIFCNF